MIFLLQGIPSVSARFPTEWTEYAIPVDDAGRAERRNALVKLVLNSLR